MTMRTLTLAAALMMLAACGDDSGYTQTVDPATMCGGSFAAVNRGTLEAATMTTGACANDESLDSACTSSPDLATVAATCGGPCATNNLTDDAKIKECTTTCMAEALANDPTTACLDCYSDSVVCTKQHCLADCGANPNSPACTQCRAVNGCFTSFFTCSGFPAPAAGDAGP